MTLNPDNDADREVYVSNLINAHHKALVIDACSLIHMRSTDKMEEILASLRCPCIITNIVFSEAKTFKKLTGGVVTDEPMNLDYFLKKELLSILDLNDDEDAISFLELTSVHRLDNGEAESIVIADKYNYAFCTNDRKALNIMTNEYPHLQSLTTLHLLQKWYIEAGISQTDLLDSIAKIRVGSPNFPSPKLPLYSWFQIL